MQNSTLSLVGIPWDIGASFGQPGARYAPDEIRDNLDYFFGRAKENEIFDVVRAEKLDLNHFEYEDLGNLNLKYHDIKSSIQIMEDKARDILDSGKNIIAIGGDHSVTYPLVKALHDFGEKSIGLIQFDAHLDLLDESEKQGKFSQSSEIFRAMELENVKPGHVVQIGVRGYNYPEAFDFIKNNNIIQFTPKDVNQLPMKKIYRIIRKDIIEKVDYLYLTFDIDVLDPAYAPGVGVVEPDGLNPSQCFELLKLLAPEVDAFDLVEVNPMLDHNGITSRTGAKLIFDFMINKVFERGEI